MNKPKVSVVMTCYKYAHFLPFALDSVLGQTWGNVEAVMVNDGSPDDTDAVMQRYVGDPRVKYINQKNAGQAVAKNNGIRASTGEFIAFLDADDIWELDKLEKQMPLFADPEVGVAYCRTKFIDENNVVVYDDDALTRNYLKPQRGWIAPQLFLDNFVPFSATVTRRECFEKVGVMDESFRMGIDWDLWLRMAVPYKYDYVDERLLKYRVGHAGQMSKNLDVREVDTQRIMEKFLAEHPDAVPPDVVKRAMVYTYCNRGYRYRRIDAGKSMRYYLKALAEQPTSWTALNGLAKTCVYKAGRTVGLFGKAG